MDLKVRLQRMLQIVEGVEHEEALADIERDILLNELRAAYTELKFGAGEHEEASAAPVALESEPTKTAEDDEKEIEVEILFAEGEEDAEPQEENEISEPEPVVEPEPIAEPEPVVEPEPIAEPKPIAEPEPVVEPEPIAEPKPIAEPEPVVVELKTKTANSRRSAILSLYETDAKSIVGEQFHDRPSVADSITCAKGVAESTAISSLRDAIGVADKFMLIRELFGNDSGAYEAAIDVLDAQDSLDDCLIYISEHYVWSPNGEATKMMMELLQRKYN